MSVDEGHFASYEKDVSNSISNIDLISDLNDALTYFTKGKAKKKFYNSQLFTLLMRQAISKTIPSKIRRLIVVLKLIIVKQNA